MKKSLTELKEKGWIEKIINWWKKSVPAYVCTTCGYETNSLYDAHAHDPTHDMRHRCFAKSSKQLSEYFIQKEIRITKNGEE